MTICVDFIVNPCHSTVEDCYLGRYNEFIVPFLARRDEQLKITSINGSIMLPTRSCTSRALQCPKISSTRHCMRLSRCRSMQQSTVTGSIAAERGSRGKLQLYLDSASVQQWDRWAASRLFYGGSATSFCAGYECMEYLSAVPASAGFTTNPSILLRDQVPGCNLKVLRILAQQVIEGQIDSLTSLQILS